MEQKKKVLVIVPHEQLYLKLEPILKRDSIEVSPGTTFPQAARPASTTARVILRPSPTFGTVTRTIRTSSPPRCSPLIHPIP